MKREFHWEQLPLLLTTEDLASILCLERATIRRLRRENKLVSIKIGKKYYFERSELEKIFRKGKDNE